MSWPLIFCLLFSLLVNGLLAQTAPSPNATNCTQVNSLVTIGPVDAVRGASDAARSSLATILLQMNASASCTISTSVAATWHVCGKSGNVKIYLNGAELIHIISWGAAALAMVAPYQPDKKSLDLLGLSPEMDDSTRPLLFIISIERMTATGAMANSDEMIMDVTTITYELGYVLMFDISNKKGRKLEKEGGRWEKRAMLKVRLWLPHTSTVTGYGDGTGTSETGSSSGLYGLFALIVLPFLALAALCAYCCYSHYHSAAAMDSYVPQAAGREFTPQPYIPPQQHGMHPPYIGSQSPYLPHQPNFLPQGV